MGLYFTALQYNGVCMGSLVGEKEFKIEYGKIFEMVKVTSAIIYNCTVYFLFFQKMLVCIVCMLIA